MNETPVKFEVVVKHGADTAPDTALRLTREAFERGIVHSQRAQDATVGVDESQIAKVETLVVMDSVIFHEGPLPENITEVVRGALNAGLERFPNLHIEKLAVCEG